MRVSPTGVARQPQVITLLTDYYWDPGAEPDLYIDIPSDAWGRDAIVEIRGSAYGGGGAHCLLVYEAEVAPDMWGAIGYGLILPYGRMRITYPVTLFYGPSHLRLTTDTPERFQVESVSVTLLMR
jgi:hypothetical protein